MSLIDMYRKALRKHTKGEIGDELLITVFYLLSKTHIKSIKKIPFSFEDMLGDAQEVISEIEMED